MQHNTAHAITPFRTIAATISALFPVMVHLSPRAANYSPKPVSSPHPEPDIFSDPYYISSLACLLIMLILAVFAVYVFRTVKKLNTQKLRIAVLADISGDLIFEYEPSTGKLTLSKQFKEVFHIPYQSRPYSKGAIAGIINLDDILHRRISSEELTLPDGQHYTAVYTYIHGNGTRPLYLLGKLTDTSLQRANIDPLKSRARIDGLTYALNAAECKQLVEKYLSSIPDGQQDALMLLDIDDLKSINDAYGHYSGDQVLIKAAAALRELFRCQDVVGRFGGDEFLIYMHAVGDKASLITKCQDILQRLRIPIEEGMDEPTASASIGACLITKPELFEEAYNKADCALYAAKSGGMDRYYIFPTGENRSSKS